MLLYCAIYGINIALCTGMRINISLISVCSNMALQLGGNKLSVAHRLEKGENNYECNIHVTTTYCVN